MWELDKELVGAIDPGLVGLQMKEVIPAESFALYKSGLAHSKKAASFFGQQAFLGCQNIIKYRK